MKKIILYGFQDFKGIMQAAALGQKMSPFGAEIRTVGPSEHGRSIGSLALEEETATSHKAGPEQNADLPVRMLVFCGFTGDELDAALAICRSSGITGEDLKAVLTPDNASWSGEKLCRELVSEHNEMKKNR